MRQKYDNTNSGILFVNDKKGNDKWPDRQGSINIEGREYWLSGWLGQKNGKPYLSLKAKPKEETQQLPPGRQSSPGMPAPAPATPNDDDDEIPF